MDKYYKSLAFLKIVIWLNGNEDFNCENLELKNELYGHFKFYKGVITFFMKNSWQFSITVIYPLKSAISAVYAVYLVSIT